VWGGGSPVKLQTVSVVVQIARPAGTGIRSQFRPSDVSAVSEANGTTVPVSLDFRSSLSIQPLEGSRSRVRRTRGAMGIQSISA